MVQQDEKGETAIEMQQQPMSSYGAITGVKNIDAGDATRIQQSNADRSNTSGVYRFWGLAALFVGVTVTLLAHTSSATHSNGGILGTTSSSSSSISPDVPPMLSSALLTTAQREYDAGDVPLFFDQPVDHFDEESDRTWAHRYYKSTEFYGGPGHPIFVIVGGEGALDFGMLYPFVTKVLAKRFQAAVLQIEHRFYGPYHPVANATNDQLLNLLTPHQAMADMVHLTRHMRDSEFMCSSDRSSPDYCPIVTVGASYPGFLSALFRLVYPDFVDISYASSAPLLMYAQAVDPNIYYDIVTASAERASPGCAAAVRHTLDDAVAEVDASVTLHEAAERLGICVGSIPSYITTKEMFRDAVVMITSFSFAEYNSDNYPPGPDTGLVSICALFQNDELNTLDTLQSFFHCLMEQEEEDLKGCDFPSVNCDDDDDDDFVVGKECFDMMTQLPDPSDPNSTLMDTPGDYEDGYMWDFQTCAQVIFIIGFSDESMFPPHNATYEELNKHCQARFGMTPHPYKLVNEWDFDDLSNASYILFANGLQDMWAGGSILEDVSETVIAFNFENGAHHSDLSHEGPTDADTDDIKQGFVDIANTLELWLEQRREEWNQAV